MMPVITYYIVTLKAKDPENEEISYSIVAGNTFDHFKILKSNGTLLVNGLIDREELSRYTLTVKAEDPAGLSAIARLHIRVVDINDKNPEFVDLPYSFSVKENDLTGYIGRVHVTFVLCTHHLVSLLLHSAYSYRSFRFS